VRLCTREIAISRNIAANHFSIFKFHEQWLAAILREIAISRVHKHTLRLHLYHIFTRGAGSCFFENWSQSLHEVEISRATIGCNFQGNSFPCPAWKLWYKCSLRVCLCTRETAISRNIAANHCSWNLNIEKWLAAIFLKIAFSRVHKHTLSHNYIQLAKLTDLSWDLEFSLNTVHSIWLLYNYIYRYQFIMIVRNMLIVFRNYNNYIKQL